MSEQEPIFPIMDRRAPLLERVRGEQGTTTPNGREDFDILSLMVSHAMAGDDMREDLAEGVESDIREEVATRAGIGEEEVSDEVVSDTLRLIQKEPEDIVSESDEEGGGEEEATF